MLAPSNTPEPFPAPMQTATAMPTPLVPDSGWETLRPGLERRTLNLFDDQYQLAESIFILRVDQSAFRLDIGYHETPQTLDDWRAETGALVVVNGGYFREENGRAIPTGLTIIRGAAIGSSYEGFGGMLAIGEHGAQVRSLTAQPYNPAETLVSALQSFPLLVKPGGALGFPAENEDNQQARRTVIAQDRDGKIIFLVASRGLFTLHQLSLFLTNSDLNLDIALNLDGGPSSGILLNDPREMVNSLMPLPIVILIYAR